MKKPKYKSFDYTPRFHVPEEDKDEIRKRKLGFQRSRKVKTGMRINPIILMIIFIIILFIYFKLSNMS